MYRLRAPRPARLLVGLTLLVCAAATPVLSATAASADAGTTAQRTVSRVAGDDRFATAAAASEAFPSRSDDPSGRHIVFIASGTNFPDALSAGPAASALLAPLLLVQQNGLPASTQAALDRLQPEKIVVVGGPASVSADVAQALGKTAPVTRLAGDDRFATSRAIMRSVFVDTSSPLYAGPAQEAYIASGTNFPDALSAGAAAAHFGAPLLIVNGGAAHADPATVAMTQGLGYVTGVGGPASLNPAVLADLNENRDQYAGSDRYDTAVQVNEDSFDQSETAFLAVGTNFPDALSGGALAGLFDAPLYITPGNCVPSAVIAELDRLGVTDVELLGGPSVLSESVAALTPCS
jgi:putative cell wall-binding protein